MSLFGHFFTIHLAAHFSFLCAIAIFSSSAQAEDMPSFDRIKGQKIVGLEIKKPVKEEKGFWIIEGTYSKRSWKLIYGKKAFGPVEKDPVKIRFKVKQKEPQPPIRLLAIDQRGKANVGLFTVNRNFESGPMLRPVFERRTTEPWLALPMVGYGFTQLGVTLSDNSQTPPITIEQSNANSALMLGFDLEKQLFFKGFSVGTQLWSNLLSADSTLIRLLEVAPRISYELPWNFIKGRLRFRATAEEPFIVSLGGTPSISNIFFPDIYPTVIFFAHQDHRIDLSPKFSIIPGGVTAAGRVGYQFWMQKTHALVFQAEFRWIQRDSVELNEAWQLASLNLFAGYSLWFDWLE